jgi:hypothetical protein
MISNKTKTEDANKEFDTLRHEIIADAKDKKNKLEPQAQVLIFINSKFQREIIITLKNSSCLEWRVGLLDTILKGTHPGTIYARFGPYIDASCQVWLLIF